MNCWYCQKEMICGGDNSYEDYSIEKEDGIVANLSCSSCEAFCYFHLPLGDKSGKTKTTEKTIK